MQAMDEFLKHYSDGKTWPGGGETAYKNFNLDQQGKGAFWGPVENPNSDSPERFDCNGTLPFWVPNGERPPAGTPHVITTEMLARLAFAHTRVPGVDIHTNPVGTQTVNLPTWVTLDENYAPITVRAELDIPGAEPIWAETTATPASVHIDPGTADADVFPASGECPIGANGRVGAPYTRGATGNPPCGVTYLRSTQSTGAYHLNVTATWKVTWHGSDGAADAPPLPDGVITQDHPVTVQEIQTVNR
jgi:enoyl reductase